MSELSARLVAAGHQVTVATTDALDFELFWNPQRRRIVSRGDTHDGVRILRFPVRHLPFSSLAYPGVRRLLWLLSMARPVPVGALFRLARFTPGVPDLGRWLATTSEPFDLVAGMTICFEPLLAAGLQFARQRGLPFVNYPLTHLGAGTQPGADALSRFYTMRHQVALVRDSDAVVVQTPTEGDFYINRGLPPDRVTIGGPGVNLADVLGGEAARFRQRHNLTLNGPVVVSLSAMSYDKGTVHLVEAVRRLWREGRQAELVLAGAMLAPFQHYLSTLPGADAKRLKILGPIPDAEKRDMLAAADVFAMPSRTDSFGIVYLEAWLNRLPVIAARTWGMSDVVRNGEDGLLVPFGDVSVLAQTLGRLLDHPEERTALGLRGEQKVLQQYTWEHRYAPVRDLYERLSGGR